jgi:hypothetical protein
MCSVLEFHIQINHPRGKGGKRAKKVISEILLDGKPIVGNTIELLTVIYFFLGEGIHYTLHVNHLLISS